jgi:endonuclease YncB( thermonuclease family)
MLVGLAGAGIGASLLIAGQPADLLGPAPVPAGEVSADPLLVAVVDGATLRLRDTVVRLHGVAAPARGRSCPDEQGAGYDCGAAASAALANLVRDRRVACRLNGRDQAGLVLGVCEAGGTEINRALVAAGWARADGPALSSTEATARAGRLGLWRNGANPSF